MKKKLGLMLLALMIAGSLYAGGQQEAAAEEEGPITFLWWDWQSGGQIDDPTYLGYVVNKIAAEFQKTHPNVSVERKDFSYGDYNAVLKTALASGEGPDVFEVHPGAPSNDLARAGQMVDLTNIIKGDAEWSEWIAPSLELKDMYINDKLYYIPLDVNHLPLVYWRQMFAD